jgi:hypothetical protein
VKTEATAIYLSERQAFAAMSLFVNRFADRAGDDLLTLLGDLTLQTDGGPFDPAAWDDWLSCVHAIVGFSDDRPATD